VRQFA